jgi:hypothetical protein
MGNCCTPALAVCVALARFRAGFGRCNGRQAFLPAGNLGKEVQLGLAFFSLVCVGCPLQQSFNLRFEFKLSSLHTLLGRNLKRLE